MRANTCTHANKYEKRHILFMSGVILKCHEIKIIGKKHASIVLPLLLFLCVKQNKSLEVLPYYKLNLKDSASMVMMMNEISSSFGYY